MKEEIRNKYFPLWLQVFAEGDGTGTGDDGKGDGSEGSRDDGGKVKSADNNEDIGKNNTELQSFDDFLKGEGNQAEFDRRMQKAIDTALTNAQKKWKALTDDKLSEAEKLAQMTKEEKAEYRAKQLEKELADLKRKNAVSDMSKAARKMLADEEINITDELLGHLVSEDAEDTKATVESFVKLYKSAVQEAVKDALKGKPPKAGGDGKEVTKEQILAIKNPTERQRMIAENMKLFQ